MISVFASFVLMNDPVEKLLPDGFSTAIFLDATVVRMVIVPATLALFDRIAWGLPGWLDRVLPTVASAGEPALVQHERPEGRRVVGGKGERVGVEPVGGED